MTAHPTLTLIDAHGHLQDHRYAVDRGPMLARATAAGVSTIVCSADDEASSCAAVVLAESHAGIWATVGVHPNETATCDTGALERIAELARRQVVVAFGEIGLDYYRERAPHDLQRRLFETQLTLARGLELPIVVHSREAAADTYAILQAWRRVPYADERLPIGVMHCFGYDASWAERFLDLGLMISIPGTVTYPKAAQMQQAAAAVPDDHLTVETDCPYLAPQSHRGRRNEPAYLPETVHKIATLRDVDPLQLARHTVQNTRRLYRLDDRERTDVGRKGSP